jgi:hypothetical protein
MILASQLRAAVSGKLRTALFQGREHIVVPVVALVEGVIFASNSETPELVLASEFSKNLAGWNGRPTVGDHPSRNGLRVSANVPKVLEAEAFGQVFEAHVEGDRLLMEAWLDPARAKDVGTAAKDVISRLRAASAVDVSVGVFVDAEETAGTWKDGRRYGAIWRNITPDHLAFLPAGTPGACSLEMGCGAPKAAAAAAHHDPPTGRFHSIAGTDPSAPLFDRETYVKNAGPVLGGLRPEMTMQSTSPKGPTHGRYEVKRSDKGFSVSFGGKFVGSGADGAEASGLIHDHAHGAGRFSEATQEGRDAAFDKAAPELYAKIIATVKKSAQRPAVKVVKRGASAMTKSDLAILATMKAQPTFATNVLGLLGFRSATASPDGQQSDMDLRSAIDKALRATEPGYLGIEAVYGDSVVFACAPENEICLYQRSFAQASDGSIELDGKNVEVKPQTQYEPVGASAACGCGASATQEPAVTTEDEPMKEVTPEKKARVAALIATLAAHGSEVCKMFTASDFEQWDDDRLATLEAKAPKAAAAPPAVAAGAATAASETPKAKTPEEERIDFFSKHPDVAAVVQEHKAAAAAKQTTLVDRLKVAQKTYTEDELKALPLAQLEKLASALSEVVPTAASGKRDFSGAGAPRAAAGADNAPPPPIDMTARIRAARGIATKTA